MKKQKKLILERQKEYRKAQYQNIINSKKFKILQNQKV
jgi:hypothetical protein